MRTHLDMWSPGGSLGLLDPTWEGVRGNVGVAQHVRNIPDDELQ